MVDLSSELTGDALGAAGHAGQPGGADPVPAFDRAPAGGRGDRSCIRARSAASVRPPTKGSSTTSSCRGRSCLRTSRPSRRRCANWPPPTCRTNGRCGRARKPSGSSPGAASRSRCSSSRRRPPDSRASPVTRSRIATRSWISASGPHVPSTGRLKAFKLLQRVERLLEGRRAQSADAADLRHGILQGRRPQAAPASD